ncbi:MAG: NAD(P)H:quinone oxidoreductase [Acidiferrobacter sp.]
MTDILILYYSRHGSVRRMAELVGRGVERVAGCVAILRTVPEVSPIVEATAPVIPDDGPPYGTLADVAGCDGLILGSPTRFGHMAAPLKYFLETTTPLWLGGALAGKPAAVFTSTGTLHGGQEATLLSMAVPLLHHGMVLVGLPYTTPELSTTRTGGGPYGASHLAGVTDREPISDDERILCQVLGERVAQIAQRLTPHR